MADKKVVIPDDLGNNFELNNKKWRVKLGKGLAPNSSGAIALDSNTIGEAIAEAIGNAPGTGMGVKNGKLVVLRSPDAGNLLEVRENGVYYGVVAQQENWYVDSAGGNDNNKGTKEAPLKTLHGLHNKLKNGSYSYNIYLKEGGTYPVKNNDTNEFTNLFGHLTAVSSINIFPYGNRYDDVINSDAQVAGNGGHYIAHAVKSFSRPAIQFSNYIYTFSNGVNSVRTCAIFNNNIKNIRIRGIKLEVIGNNYPASYDHSLGSKIKCGKLVFEGCVFSFANRPTNIWAYPFVAGVSSVAFTHCAVENPRNNQDSPYAHAGDTLITIFLNDLTGEATTGGANGTTAYEIYRTNVDFVPYLKLDNPGDRYLNMLYMSGRSNYLINRDDV